MFCSLFCNINNREDSKPSAVFQLPDQETIEIQFPQAVHQNQPSQSIDGENSSLSASNVFDPISEIASPKHSIQKLVTFQEEPTVIKDSPLPAAVVDDSSNPHLPEEETAKLDLKEKTSDPDQRSEKENTWREKRLAKKVNSGKKKSKRNKTRKNNKKASKSLHVRGEALSDARAPLGARN